jgi:glycosyltransferase involved in cell wall biosynthesis
VHVADHSYAHCLRAFPGVPSVVTIHDLYPLQVLREGQRGLRASIRDALLGRVLDWVRRADLLIAVSRFTADEAVRLLGIPGERIRVASNGVDDSFFTAADSPRAPPAARRTILHVGSCVPRKNIEAVITTMQELRRRGVAAVLHQIGGRFTAAQRRQIEHAGLSPYVSQQPGVTEAALIAAYRDADVLLFPSHYEGFGLPALEALATGLPVVTSGAGGLAEAVGDAAIIVNPPEPERLADAVERLLGSADARDSLRRRGLERARRFTWDASAAVHRQVYGELLSRR